MRVCESYFGKGLCWLTSFGGFYWETSLLPSTYQRIVLEECHFTCFVSTNEELLCLNFDSWIYACFITYLTKSLEELVFQKKFEKFCDLETLFLYFLIVIVKVCSFLILKLVLFFLILWISFGMCILNIIIHLTKRYFKFLIFMIYSLKMKRKRDHLPFKNFGFKYFFEKCRALFPRNFIFGFFSEIF